MPVWQPPEKWEGKEVLRSCWQVRFREISDQGREKRFFRSAENGKGGFRFYAAGFRI